LTSYCVLLAESAVLSYILETALSPCGHKLTLGCDLA
jgi:hypothetical protein